MKELCKNWISLKDLILKIQTLLQKKKKIQIKRIKKKEHW